MRKTFTKTAVAVTTALTLSNSINNVESIQMSKRAHKGK